MENETKAKHESLVWNVWPDTGKRLNLSKTTVWKYVHDGTIPSVVIGGRYLVPKAALAKLLETGWQPVSDQLGHPKTADTVDTYGRQGPKAQ